MKLTRISIACAALAIATTGAAHADSFGSALLDVSNFKWTDANGVALTQGLQLVVNSGSNSGNLSAILKKGATTVGSATDGSFASILDGNGGQIAPKFVCTDAPNGSSCGSVPNLTGTPNGMTYGYSSHSLSGAIINIGPVAAGATASTYSQTDLSGGIVGQSSGTSSSTLDNHSTFVFRSSTDLITKFVLSYDIKLLATVVAPYNTIDTATAGSTWLLNINDQGKDLDNDGQILTPAEEAFAAAGNNFSFAPAALNKTISAYAPPGTPNTATWYRTATDFTSNDFTLLKDHVYSFDLTTVRTTSAFRNVPEPGSIALLGIGLLGLVIPSLKKRGSRSA
jgi:hypothetical protein